MKTKEEILKRNTEAIAKCSVKYNVTHQGILNAMEEYATQCQEDMADKKYTEKQLLDAMSFAECYIIEHDKPLFLKSDGKPVPDCLEYINSLNKQD